MLKCKHRRLAALRTGSHLILVYALLLPALTVMLSGCGATIEPAAQLTAIAIGPPDAVLAKGSTSQLVATGIYSDGSRRELVSAVTWSTADAGVATVSNVASSAGLLTAVNIGSTTVIATAGTISGATGLTVTDAALLSIDVTPPNPSLPDGHVFQFTATGTYSDHSTQNLTPIAYWTTSRPGVAALGNGKSAGLATLTAVGSTSISATVAGITGGTTLTGDPAALVSIEITPTSARVAAGLTQQFMATGVFSDGSSHDLTSLVAWSSSAPLYATISNLPGSAGLVTTLSQGSTDITATFRRISATTAFTVSAATLVSIGVSPPTSSVAKGIKARFTATGIFTDGSTHVITDSVLWSSAAPTVLALSNASGFNGLATALSPGTTTIGAASGTVAGSATVTVTAAMLLEIAITPALGSIPEGTAQQFTAMGTYTDSVQTLTTTVTWASSANAVATISNAAGSNGLATSSSEGAATITASFGGMSAIASLSVTAAALASISVTPALHSIADGTDQQFTATGIYTDNSLLNLTTSATWSSSATAVAAISNAAGTNGLSTALGAGTTTITAAFAGIAGSTGFTVSATRLVSIAVTPVNPSIGVGTVQQLTATGIFSDGSTQNLTSAATWTSTDTGVAAIQNEPGFNGLALAEGSGTSTITALLNGISGTTRLTVVPAALLSIVVTPADPSIPDGAEQQFTAMGHYADGSLQDITASVTWNPADSVIASISNAPGSVGIATALHTGSTAITAALGPISGFTNLTVVAASLVSIAVTPPRPSIANSYGQWFVATGTYTDGSTKTVTTAVAWQSSASAVATISNAAGSHGYATAAGVGSTSVSAGLGSIESPAITLTVIAGHEYAYVANNASGTIAQYTIGGSGVLNAMNPATVRAGAYPMAIAVDPSYRYAYAANDDDDTVSEYTIGAATGALTPMTLAAVAAGDYPQSLAVDPTGRFLYVVNNGDFTTGSVSQFTLGAGGALAPINPAAVSILGIPVAMAVDPSGRYVYVANAIGSIEQFAIGPGGALTAMNPASVPAGTLPQAITVDPTGRYVYVANGGYVPNGSGGAISQFGIGPGGELSALNPPTVGTGNDPISVAVDPSGRYVYAAASSDGTLWQYSIGIDGALSVVNPGNAQAGGDPQSVTVDLSGLYIYAADDNGLVAQFSLGASGTLGTSSATSTALAGAQAVATAY